MLELAAIKASMRAGGKNQRSMHGCRPCIQSHAPSGDNKHGKMGGSPEGDQEEEMIGGGHEVHIMVCSPSLAKQRPSSLGQAGLLLPLPRMMLQALTRPSQLYCPMEAPAK